MFRDRTDAGHELARALSDLRVAHPVVLALPRGGVPLAAIVAEELDAPLDVIVVRKIGVPGSPEFAVGALGEDGTRLLDAALIDRLGIDPAELEAVEDEERAVLQQRSATLRAVAPPVSLRGRTALIIDDGLATGATARTACRIARARGAARVVVAVPCAPDDASAVELEADELRVVEVSSAFGAVGQFYADFDQVDDATVRDLLVAARQARPPRPAVRD